MRLLAVLFALTALVRAETLEEKRDAKLKKPFVSAAPWILDYDKAREAAKASGKLVFAYFTRSYAG